MAINLFNPPFTPIADDVRDGVITGNTTGNLVLPTEAQVEDGVSFGANGTEFTGTFVGGGGGSALGYFTVSTVYNNAANYYTFTGSNKITLGESGYTQTLTFATWFRSSDATQRKIILSNIEFYSSTFAKFPFSLNLMETGQIQAYLSGGDDFTIDLTHSAGSGLNDGNWHHLGYILTPTTSVIYIDGTISSSQSHSVVLSVSGLPYTLGAPANYYYVSSGANFIGDLKRPIFAPSINNSQIILDSYADNS